MRNETDRLPCNPLHDEVLTGFQMFDDVFVQSGLSLYKALDDFIEVKGSQVEHVQYPGEAHVCFCCFTASMVVSSVFETAL